MPVTSQLSLHGRLKILEDAGQKYDLSKQAQIHLQEEAATRPFESALALPLRTEDDRCTGTIKDEHAVRHPVKSKLETTRKGSIPELSPEWLNVIPTMLKSASGYTSEQVLAILKGYEEAVETKRKLDYWLTEEGQAKLDEKAKENERPPNEFMSPDHIRQGLSKT